MSSKSATPEKKEPLISLRMLALCIATGAGVTVAFAGWSDIYNSYLEHTAPTIRYTEAPRGVGIAPVSVEAIAWDFGSGLQSVSAGQRQSKGSQELIPTTKQDGRRQVALSIQIPGRESSFDQGHATLSINATDTSLWKNARTEPLDLVVDYHKPVIKVISTPTSLAPGNVGLIIYQATDEEMSETGIKIGNTYLPGFLSRSFAPSITDSDLYMALVAVPFDTPPGTPIEIFADDRVGNSTVLATSITIGPRTSPTVSMPLDQAALQSYYAVVADREASKINALFNNDGSKVSFTTNKGSNERLIEQFKVVNTSLREYNQTEVKGKVSQIRLDQFWANGLTAPLGTSHIGFGAKIIYTLNGAEIGTSNSLGYSISPPRGEEDVVSLADGIVIFSDQLGVYGRVVAVDHGLGVVTLYGQLDDVSVRPGKTVEEGEIIGRAGKSAINGTYEYYQETRVSGVAVDGHEWWDHGVFNAKVTQRIREFKRSLGLPVEIE